MLNVRRQTLVAGLLVAALFIPAAVALAQPTSQPAGAGGKDISGGEQPAVAPAQGQPAPASQPAPTGAPAEGEKPQQNSSPFGNYIFPLMIGAFILLYFWMGRGQRKRDAERKKMLAALKKGDKITSIGGIVGTVIEVRDDEVTVKVDETNNVRMKFARWAIRGIGEEAKTETPEDKK